MGDEAKPRICPYLRLLPLSRDRRPLRLMRSATEIMNTANQEIETVLKIYQGRWESIWDGDKLVGNLYDVDECRSFRDSKIMPILRADDDEQFMVDVERLMADRHINQELWFRDFVEQQMKWRTAKSQLRAANQPTVCSWHAWQNQQEEAL